MNTDLPRNTVVRLSQYRRLLEKYRYMDEPYIFSHDLARMLHLKPVNVRHDLMLLGMQGDRRKGYSITVLLEKISEKIDRPGREIILVGMGRLGLSLIDYLQESDSRLRICAAFDVDPEKVNRKCESVPCYSITELPSFARERSMTTAILAVPPGDVSDILPILIDAGIRGILNYTSERLAVPGNVIVRDVDIVTYLEEIRYFISQ